MNSGDWVENLTALEYDGKEWTLYKYEEDEFIDENQPAILPIQKRFKEKAVIG